MYQEYQEYILGLRDSLIRSGVGFEILREYSYEDLFYLGEAIGDVLWFYNILAVANSRVKLKGFPIPLGVTYLEKIRGCLYDEYCEENKELAPLRVESYSSALKPEGITYEDDEEVNIFGEDGAEDTFNDIVEDASDDEESIFGDDIWEEGISEENGLVDTEVEEKVYVEINSLPTDEDGFYYLPESIEKEKEKLYNNTVNSTKVEEGNDSDDEEDFPEISDEWEDLDDFPEIEEDDDFPEMFDDEEEDGEEFPDWSYEDEESTSTEMGTDSEEDDFPEWSDEIQDSDEDDFPKDMEDDDFPDLFGDGEEGEEDFPELLDDEEDEEDFPDLSDGDDNEDDELEFPDMLDDEEDFPEDIVEEEELDFPDMSDDEDEFPEIPDDDEDEFPDWSDDDEEVDFPDLSEDDDFPDMSDDEEEEYPDWSDDESSNQKEDLGSKIISKNPDVSKRVVSSRKKTTTDRNIESVEAMARFVTKTVDIGKGLSGKLFKKVMDPSKFKE